MSTVELRDNLIRQVGVLLRLPMFSSKAAEDLRPLRSAYNAYLTSLGHKQVTIIKKEPPMPGIPAPAVTRNFTPAGSTPRLHPLHTAEYLDEMVRLTGRYPDPDRRTGRTTVLALQAITQALKNPHQPITVRDHFENNSSHREVLRTALQMAECIGLKHLVGNETHCTLTFTN